MSNKEDTLTFYKLRDKSTGLYSTGANGDWNETGKSWSKIGWVKSSIRQRTSYLENTLLSSRSSEQNKATARVKLQHILDNWEIIEVVTKVSELSATPVGELMKFRMGEEDDRP